MIIVSEQGLSKAELPEVADCSEYIVYSYVGPGWEWALVVMSICSEPVSLGLASFPVTQDRITHRVAGL